MKKNEDIEKKSFIRFHEIKSKKTLFMTATSKDLVSDIKVELYTMTDENQVNKKASHISDIIDDVERLYHLKEYQLALKTGKKLRNKLRNFRKCGLQREGEFSSENLAFKLLRRNGYLRKLADFLVNSYDKSNSMPPGKRDLEDIIDNL